MKVTSHFHFRLIKSKKLIFYMEGGGEVEREVSDFVVVVMSYGKLFYTSSHNFRS
jgi:hypothetical protein